MAKKVNYFESIESLMGFACTASEYLNETLEGFDPETLDEKLETMHGIEHSADMQKHELIAKLVAEFITPIEREDILLMLQKIDDVTDSIEEVLRKAYMFNIASIRPDAIEFANIINQCCQATRLALSEFHDFRKSKHIRDYIIKVNELEEAGDRLHRDSIHRLYCAEQNPVAILTWTEMYECLERCCDACEDVSEVIETVMMKNS
ncbi:MAG TPA: DUF47 family protein [Clostridia bacterium]|jgi:predicted phosphate transport protein (TIGR00153 family)|nr:DUF47 family protein [Clostridia bacterium]